jgi:hypothetical protein
MFGAPSSLNLGAILVCRRVLCEPNLTVPIYADSYFITVPMAAEGGPKATVQIKPNKNRWPSITYLKYNVYFVSNDAAGDFAWLRPLHNHWLKAARGKTEMLLYAADARSWERGYADLCWWDGLNMQRSAHLGLRGSSHFHVESTFLSFPSNCVSFCPPIPLCCLSGTDIFTQRQTKELPRRVMSTVDPENIKLNRL